MGKEGKVFSLTAESKKGKRPNDKRNDAPNTGQIIPHFPDIPRGAQRTRQLKHCAPGSFWDLPPGRVAHAGSVYPGIEKSKGRQLQNELYSAYAASQALEKDRQTIVRALRDVPPDGKAGSQPRWKLATIVKALEAGPRGAGSNGKSQEAGLTEARAELAREQTAAVAMKNAVARGEFVPAVDVDREWGRIITTFKERMLAVPGKIAGSCEMRSRGEIEEIVRAEIYEALDELSRPVSFGSGSAVEPGEGSGEASSAPDAD